ncbi:MAG: SAM-dependent methyltransferase [Clostridiales bacterium]|nr:SAM-dependent methyltransferase [Clostridiales bacterium]
MDKVFKVLENVIENEKLIYAVFSNVRKGVEKEFVKLNVKPVLVKNERVLQFEYEYDQKVYHENLSNIEAIDIAFGLIKTYFKQAMIYTIDADYQVLVSKKGVPKILEKAPSRNTFDLSHNRKKNYIIEENKPCNFLHALGVMDEHGKVFQKKYDKFRQINRYLEMIADCVPHLKSDRKIQVVDFGCGKAYLTFAMYYYFVELKKLNVDIIGLDLKTDVIETCSHLAKSLNYKNLHFVQGDIKNFTGLEQVDMVVSLHACDTATDESLAKAVSWDADVILAVPCCQHELFKKIHNPVMKTMEKHGLIKERLSSLITDSIRANALEIMGYNTQMLEFIDMEHTAKNILIRAYKTGEMNACALKEYKEFTSFWHVKPYIEQALGEPFRSRIED